MNAPSPLESILDLHRVDATSFEGAIPDGWQQGRGAFGGLAIGIMARAAATIDAAGGRALRSLTAELVGPVLPGAVSVRVEVLRAGSGVTTMAARLEQSGETQAHAVAVLGKRRGDGGDWVELEPPPMPPWRDVPLLDMASFAPTFAQHLEFRPTGPLPFSRAASARASGWVRPRVAPSRYDDALVAALADAWWPAAFSRLDAPRPIATIAYALEIVGDAASLDPSAPLHHSAHAVAARDGYVVELRELRGADGRLVALNQQTIALIR